MKKNNKIVYIFLFLASTLLIFLPLFFKDYMSQFGSLGIFGVFLINFFSSSTLFLPSPAIFSVAVGGNLYNPLLVALFASIGSTLGEGTGFLFGHSSKKTLGFEQKHKVMYYLSNFLFTKYGIFIIFLFSLVPNPVFDGIGIFAGIASFSAKRFLLAVFCGRLIRNIAIAYFGTTL